MTRAQKKIVNSTRRDLSEFEHVKINIQITRDEKRDRNRERENITSIKEECEDREREDIISAREKVTKRAREKRKFIDFSSFT